MSELRLGLVGCGRIGEHGYVAAMRRARDVRLAGLADPELDRCAALAATVPRYPDASELVAAGGIDAVVVASPAANHLEGARLAAADGLAVLVDKPPAESSEQVVEMGDLSPAPVFGFNRRFERGIARLGRRVPAEGDLDLEIALHHRAGSWGSYQVSDDALLTLGPHLIDLARWLTRSEIERVRTLELTPSLARLELSLPRGRALISCGTDSGPEDLITIRGDRRSLVYSWGGYLRRGLRLARRPFGAGSLVGSLALQLEAFVAELRGRAEGLLANTGDALAVMLTIEAARRSAAQGE